MNDVTGARPPVWYWVLAILGLLWEAFGVATYLMHVGVIASDTSSMNQAEVALMETIPSWATAAYAVAVFAGLLGAAGLLLRKSWARSLLMLSLIAVVIQFTWWLFLSGAMSVIGPSVFAMPAMIIIAAILLVWLANVAVKRGWLA